MGGEDACCPRGSRFYRAAPRRKLAGIRQHVEQNLLQLVAVRAHAQHRIALRKDVRDSLAVELRRDDLPVVLIDVAQRLSDFCVARYGPQVAPRGDRALSAAAAPFPG